MNYTEKKMSWDDNITRSEIILQLIYTVMYTMMTIIIIIIIIIVPFDDISWDILIVKRISVLCFFYDTWYILWWDNDNVIQSDTE